MALTREQILAINDIEIRKIYIPEWEDYVYVRGMTGKERDEFEASIVKQRGRDTIVNMKNARAKLVVLCTVDEEGNRIFNKNDVELLAEKSAKALDRIFAVAQELSGISKDDMDELTKNSETDQSDDSILD